jgi:hypothetical protein
MTIKNKIDLEDIKFKYLKSKEKFEKQKKHIYKYSLFTIILMAFVYYYNYEIAFNIYLLQYVVTTTIFIYIPFYHLYIPYKKSLFEIEVNSKNKTLSKWFYGNSDKVNKFKTFQNYLEHL